MKLFLITIIVFSGFYCPAQKYVLVDKTMNLPVTYKNTVTIQDNVNGYFPVEKSKITDFISEVEKIAKILGDPKNKKPETMDFLVGSTVFHGFKVPLTVEERMDIVLTTDFGTSKSSMHLSDAKISNADNAFFINTWLKYIRSYVR